MRDAETRRHERECRFPARHKLGALQSAASLVKPQAGCERERRAIPAAKGRRAPTLHSGRITLGARRAKLGGGADEHKALGLGY